MTKFGRNSTIKNAGSFVWNLLQVTLFWKYVTLFVTVMGLALVTNSLVNIWITYGEHRANLIRFQREQASSAALRISQFIREIENQLGWLTYISWSESNPEQRELDGLRLLRQVPAITELTLLDGHGREQQRLSRQAMDRIGSNSDYSTGELFKTAVENKVYYGSVYFRRETEPYMTLAVAGLRREAGVAIAEVNLKHIWDVVQQIRVGQTGRAYVVDALGRLIAHPDISLVLRNIDLSQSSQVKAARSQKMDADDGQTYVVRDERGEKVLTAHARADPLNWLVFVELPEQEANKPLYSAVARSVLVLLAGLLLALLAALLLARRMVIPIQALTAGAARIGAGALDHQITIQTGDELEALGNQFNRMASQLQSSYATLERKVEERTQQLQAANLSKSRFLAAASHDLRQPLHALSLFVAQLGVATEPGERSRIATRVDAAIANINDLFNALLDISTLDAGRLDVNASDMPVDSVLTRIDATFADVAREKGLRFRVVSSSAWIRSDPILLERILLNLVSNALRYTPNGGIVVGCRRAGNRLRIDVLDSGIGIAEDQQRSVFDEFYRIPQPEGGFSDGLGLGLAIVQRLCTLLDHPISLASAPGKGSRFSVSVPLGQAKPSAVERPAQTMAALNPMLGKLVVVIDDDPLVLDGTRGLLVSWGCRVVAAESTSDALSALNGDVPNLVISDFHLKGGQTGVGTIAELRDAFHAPVPAFLTSGDVSPELRREVEASGYHLLVKPVSPMTFRAMVTRLLKGAKVA